MNKRVYGGKKMNIKKLEITKEMYERAKEVEKAEDELYSLENPNDDNTPEYIKWETLYDSFHEDYHLSKTRLREETNDIIREYERREKNTRRLLDRDKNTYRFIYKNGNAREYEFFSCYKNNNTNEIFVLKNYLIPAVINGKTVEKIECIKRNNNLDYK